MVDRLEEGFLSKGQGDGIKIQAWIRIQRERLLSERGQGSKCGL
jgi:hypothetical protein